LRILLLKSFEKMNQV